MSETMAKGFDDSQTWADDADARLERFLQRLSRLSSTLGIYVRACGCCNSPWLDDSSGTKLGDDLRWDADRKAYTLEVRSR